MRTEVPVLLSEFFGPHGGSVLYKAYFPQRGDDVAALVDLAVALPSNVRFLPVSPYVETIHDIRRMLPMFLADLGVVQGQPAAPRKLTDEARKLAKENLQILIEHSFDRVPSLGMTPEEILDRLEQHEEAMTLLLRMTDPEIMGSSEQKKESPHTLRLPDHGPILILGRPDMIGDYHVAKSEMLRLLNAAGFPNRFDFVGSTDEILSSAEVLRDRKTRLRYRRRERRKDDVGFIFRGRTPNGQSVIVIEGGTSLGTYAAVRLLLHPGQVVEKAVGAANASDASPTIDIGFRCELREEALQTPFPLTHEPRRLKVDILNPSDVVGFRWARQAAQLLGPLLDAWEPDGARDPFLRSTSSDGNKVFMEWRCGKPSAVKGEPCGRFLPVEIRSRAYRISDQQVVRPSGKFGDVLDQVIADLKRDRTRWRRRFGVWLVDSPSRSIVRGMDLDSTRETLRPILLIGPTGAGKEFVTRLVARGWNGRTLPVNEFGVAEKTLRQNRNAYLDKAQAFLDGYAKDWLKCGGEKQPFDQLFHTLSPVAVPDTLLNAEMFGIAAFAATESSTAVGAFTAAGTGILFLDELLELDISLQSRFLVALQTAQVNPIGARKAYCYLCRVVAATNKAHNAEQLWRLAENRGVRNDLVSRFSRRYEVPSLCERAPEIVTGLMEMVRLELAQIDREERLAVREPHEHEHAAVCPHLRISRPAFEALVSHHFDDNFRGLKRVFDTLPEDMICSFRSTMRNRPLPEIAACSIRLEHLRTLLGISANESAQDHSSGGGAPAAEREEETDFYEFSFGPDLGEECDPAPTAGEWEELPALELDLENVSEDMREPYMEFHRGLDRQLARYESLRRHAMAVFGEEAFASPPQTETLNSENLVKFFTDLDEECQNDLAALLQLVMRAFAGVSPPTPADLARVFKSAEFSKEMFPLWPFTTLDPFDRATTVSESISDKIEQKLKPLRKGAAADVAKPGKRGVKRGVQVKTALALLAGSWTTS